MAKIAIVGAGPAGCSAGYHLANSGHQVVLIDKATFPRDKVCGDGVSLGAIQALSAMQIYPQTIREYASEFLPINGFLLGVSNGKVYQATSPLVAFCVPRFVLDNLLYQKAIDAGCIGITASISKLETQLEDSHSSVRLNEFDQVIDARGVTAGVVNAFALRAYWTIRAEDYIAYSAAKIQIYFDPALGVNGYGWIFPVDQKDGAIKLNLGVIVFKDEYQKIKQNIIRLFQNFVERNQITQALSQKTICQQQAQAFPLAVGQPNHQVTQGTILKIGDAANLADPVNGEGIGNAILSGMAVAQAINMSGSPETAAANWQHLYDMQFKPHIEAGLRVRRLRRYWFMNPLLIRLMQRHQGLADQVGASAIAGLIGYDELGFKPLTKTFLFNSLSI